MDSNTRDNYRKLLSSVGSKKEETLWKRASDSPSQYGYRIAPEIMFGSSEFSPVDVVVYATVQKYASRSGVCSCTRRTLLISSGISERNFRRSLSYLTKMKIIHTHYFRKGNGCEAYLVPLYTRDIAIGSFEKMGFLAEAQELAEFFGENNFEKIVRKGQARKEAATKRRELKKLHDRPQVAYKEANITPNHDRPTIEPPSPYSIIPPTSVDGTTKRACAREEVGSDDPPPDAAYLFDQGIKKDLKKQLDDLGTEKAMQIFRRLSPDELASKQNITGWLIAAVRNGWGERYLERKSPEEVMEESRSNKKIAEEVESYAHSHAREGNWKYSSFVTCREGLEVTHSGANAEAELVEYSLSSGEFIKKLLEVAEKRAVEECPLFDSLRSQLLSLVPDAPGQGSTTPRSTAREPWPSSSSPRHQGSTLTPDRSMSSSSSPSRYPPQQAQRIESSSMDPPTRESPTCPTSSSTRRTLSTDFSGRMTNKSLASVLGKFTEAIPEQRSG